MQGRCVWCAHVCACVHACAHTCVLKMMIYKELCTFLSLPERPSGPSHTGLCLVSFLLFSLPLRRSHRARAAGPEGKRRRGWKATIGQGQEGVTWRESGEDAPVWRGSLSSCRRALSGSKGARRVTPPHLFLQETTALTLLHSGLISCFTSDARLRCCNPGHVGGGRSAPPAAPPQAELKELIVRVAPRCLGWAPPTSPPHAAAGLCMV